MTAGTFLLQKCCATNVTVCTPAVEGPQWVVRMLVRRDSVIN
jgi:hypothetical protein